MKWQRAPAVRPYTGGAPLLLTLGTGVKNAMTTHAAEFPNSAATVTALDTALTAFASSRQAAEDGKVAQQARVDAKDADRVAVEDQLRILAGQVHEVAQGDEGGQLDLAWDSIRGRACTRCKSAATRRRRPNPSAP